MPPTLGNSRSRNNARRKADDDSAYIGASGLGKKRVASGGLELSAERAKRKRLESNLASSSSLLPAAASTAKRDEENRPIYMDFEALPPEVLHRYLHHWGLIPPLHLLSSPTPFLPSDLLLHFASATPEPIVTPANRPRRESKEMLNRRRQSSQIIGGNNIAVMADIDGVHQAYAAIAEQHFQRRTAVKEVEVLTNFLLTASRCQGTSPLNHITIIY